MNKHIIVVIVASIVIAGSLGFSFWNVFAAEQIQFRTVKEGYFSYFDMTNNPKIYLCNPLPLPASFNEIRVSMVYVDEKVGVIHFPDVFLESSSENLQQGKFESDNFKQTQYLALHFDGMYNGVIPSRIDLENITIETEIDSKVLGFIPVTTVEKYPGLEFWFLMNNQDTDYSC